MEQVTPMISPAACGRSMICIERELRTLLCKERDHAYTITGVNTQDSFDQTAIATRKCIFTYYLELNELYGGDIDAEMTYTAINLYDRFIPLATARPDTQGVAHLHQLAALVALSISCKVHGCRIFNQGVLAKLSGDRFSAAELTIMEIHMLRVLNWSIHPSTPKIVLEYMKQIIFFDSDDQQLVGCTSQKMDYYLDLVCSDHKSLQFPSSAVAMVCLVAGFYDLFQIPDKIKERIEYLENELIQHGGPSAAATLNECDNRIGGIITSARSDEEAELSGFVATSPIQDPLRSSRQTSPDSVLRSISPPATSTSAPPGHVSCVKHQQNQLPEDNKKRNLSTVASLDLGSQSTTY